MDTIEIIFLVVDIIEFFIIFFMAKILSNTIKEYNKKTLLSISLGVILTAHPTLFVILLILAILFFLVICELAYKIHYFKTKEVVKKEKSITVPYELYHYDGQVVDGVEYKERSNKYDEMLLEDVPVEDLDSDENEEDEENDDEEDTNEEENK